MDAIRVPATGQGQSPWSGNFSRDRDLARRLALNPPTDAVEIGRDHRSVLLRLPGSGSNPAVLVQALHEGRPFAAFLCNDPLQPDSKGCCDYESGTSRLVKDLAARAEVGLQPLVLSAPPPFHLFGQAESALSAHPPFGCERTSRGSLTTLCVRRYPTVRNFQEYAAGHDCLVTEMEKPGHESLRIITVSRNRRPSGGWLWVGSAGPFELPREIVSAENSCAVADELFTVYRRQGSAAVRAFLPTAGAVERSTAFGDQPLPAGMRRSASAAPGLLWDSSVSRGTAPGGVHVFDRGDHVEVVVSADRVRPMKSTRLSFLVAKVGVTEWRSFWSNFREKVLEELPYVTGERREGALRQLGSLSVRSVVHQPGQGFFPATRGVRRYVLRECANSFPDLEVFTGMSPDDPPHRNAGNLLEGLECVRVRTRDGSGGALDIYTSRGSIRRLHGRWRDLDLAFYVSPEVPLRRQLPALRDLLQTLGGAESRLPLEFAAHGVVSPERGDAGRLAERLREAGRVADLLRSHGRGMTVPLRLLVTPLGVSLCYPSAAAVHSEIRWGFGPLLLLDVDHRTGPLRSLQRRLKVWFSEDTWSSEERIARLCRLLEAPFSAIRDARPLGCTDALLFRGCEVRDPFRQRLLRRLAGFDRVFPWARSANPSFNIDFDVDREW